MKQYHLEQEIQRLNIHWDIVTVCQYNCSYCYARKDYKTEGWNKLPSLEDQLKVIDAISSSSLPYNLGLLGGEPTLHIHYNDLITYIHNKLRDSDKLYVVSNGEKDFSDHIELDKLVMLWSYHPEYTKEDIFFRNVEIMKSKGFKYKINIMLHPGKVYWKRTKEFIYKCIEKGYRIHPHFIYKDVYNLFNYTKDFWEYFRFLDYEIEKDLVYNKELYNDYSLFYSKKNKFKGWNCYNNNYEINIDYNINQFCKSNKGINLLKEPDFFKNINKVKPIVCNFSSCNCDGLLKQYKESKC